MFDWFRGCFKEKSQFGQKRKSKGAFAANRNHCHSGICGRTFEVRLWCTRECIHIRFIYFWKSHVLQVVMFLVLYMATTGNQPPTYTMIAAFLLLLYNGKRGKWKAKYLFYWFYPIHIFVLYVIAQLFL